MSVKYTTSADGACPKCGNCSVSAQYVTPIRVTERPVFAQAGYQPPSRDSKVDGESLHITCPCGFSWQVPCHDSGGAP